VAALVDHMGESTFNSAASVRRTLLSQMPLDSQGRTNYDRTA